MGWTKRQFVEQAFSEIGLAGYAFDLDPAQLQTALRQLDSMMAVWSARGVRLGWPLPSAQANSDLDQDSNAPTSANEAIYLNLATRIAPGFGKTVAIETKVFAKQSYELLLSLAAQPTERNLPYTMPMGAGNRYSIEPFARPQQDPILAGSDGPLDFN